MLQSAGTRWGQLCTRTRVGTGFPERDPGQAEQADRHVTEPSAASIKTCANQKYLRCHMHIPESLRNPWAKSPIPVNKILCQYGRLRIVHSLLSQDILITLESRCIDDSVKKLIVFDAWQTLHMFYFLRLHNHPSARCHEVTNKNMT